MYDVRWINHISGVVYQYVEWEFAMGTGDKAGPYNTETEGTQKEWVKFPHMLEFWSSLGSYLGLVPPGLAEAGEQDVGSKRSWALPRSLERVVFIFGVHLLYCCWK
jgi:hypothetical protein